MTEIRLMLMEAIACKRTVAASYNGQRVRLAPHVLFERRGELFIRALNLDKVWRSDEEPRLGQFKLAGLGDPEVLDEGFAPIAGYDAAPPQPGDALVMAV